MPRVIHFELPADDPERASRFYSDVFGWEFHKWDGPEEYYLIQTGAQDKPGIDGGMMRSRQEGPKAATNTIDVPSIDEYIAKIESAGGKVIMPKTAIPGIGYLAYCTDTEGITFGIMQGDPSAQ